MKSKTTATQRRANNQNGTNQPTVVTAASHLQVAAQLVEQVSQSDPVKLDSLLLDAVLCCQEKKGRRKKERRAVCSQEESNLHLRFTRTLFWPLNYESFAQSRNRTRVSEVEIQWAATTPIARCVTRETQESVG